MKKSEASQIVADAESGESYIVAHALTEAYDTIRKLARYGHRNVYNPCPNFTLKACKSEEAVYKRMEEDGFKIEKKYNHRYNGSVDILVSG